MEKLDRLLNDFLQLMNLCSNVYLALLNNEILGASHTRN